MFHENKDLLPTGDSYDISPGNYDPTEGIGILLIGTYISNKTRWTEVNNEDQTGGTNTLFF